MQEKGQNENIYQINLAGLSVGEHVNEFHVDREVFDIFGNKMITECDIDVNTVLSVRPNIKEIELQLKGTVTLQCDRCLGPFDLEIDQTEKAVLQQDTGESVNDISIIGYDAANGHVALDQFIYDMIVTGLPLKKAHKDNSLCDQEMISLLEEKKNNSKGNPDPRWDKLKNLI